MVKEKIKEKIKNTFNEEKINVDGFFSYWEKTDNKLSFIQALKEVIGEISFENKGNENYMYPTYLILYSLVLKLGNLLKIDHSYEPHVKSIIDAYALFIKKINDIESAVFISILLLMINISSAHKRIILGILNKPNQQNILPTSINLLISEIWKEPDKRNLLMKNFSFYKIISVLYSLDIILETKDVMNSIETNVLSLMYDEDPLIRLATINLLNKFGSSDIEPEVIYFLENESEKNIRKLIIETLGKIGTKDSFQLLFKLLRSGDYRESALAGQTLDKLANRQGFENRYSLIEYNRPKKFTFTESLRTIAIFISLFGLLLNIIIDKLWVNIPALVETILSSILIIIVSIIILSLIVAFVRNRIIVKKYKNQLKQQ